ncbi:MAG: hypothetical protein EXX96DRAFT_479374 [Benjaminiella poitrasii]|nr:MAG: hypothetical protein EXX96DRAFT_479374 [Benjaminiella poitrasii]
MLENRAFKDVFCWSVDGTTFFVKDTNEFSKSILPKHFKHCNFASFVRQLNKYDFHKIRNTEEGGQRPYGDQAWEFIHPKFMRDRKDLLEDIKRKVPGNNKQKTTTASNKEQEIPNVAQTDVKPVKSSTEDEDLQMLNSQEIRNIGVNLQSQIDQLKRSRTAMEDNIEKLKQTDEHIMSELASFSKTMAEKDSIIQDFLKLVVENEKELSSTHNRQSQAQNLLETYARISQLSTERINKLNKALGIPPAVVKKEPSFVHKSISKIQQQEGLLMKPQNLSLSADPETVSAAAAAASMNAGSLIGSPLKTADGLTFVTLGRLSSNMAVRDNKPAIEIMAADQTPTFTTSSSNTAAAVAAAAVAAATGTKQKSLSPSSSTNASSSSSSQVSWTVPPRILLVDDDSVYRDLSGKLLQVVGCTIDLAKDGVEALKKMGLEKYDLILMDIVMPKMDGISATRSIRQYDALTPIISMTSNFTDNDIMQYIGSGMTDILPKPFSKRTLYQMLEKYCAHLKAIQRVQGLEPTPSSQPMGNISLLPNVNTTSNNIIGSSSMDTSSVPMQQQTSIYPPPPSTSSSTPSSAVVTTAAPNAFPLAPYPYPVTMNSVPINGALNNMTNNDISNVTFWPQQPPQQQNPPPAIIPNNDGKFIWAVPTTNAIPTTTQQKSISFDSMNKKPRIE